jgi:hypothetical protein
VCVGAPKSAPDGSEGTSESATCTTDGRFPSVSETCTDDQLCRLSGTAVPTGCVECIGPSVSGGNQSGLVDSRCTDGATLQVCGNDNKWQAAAACGDGLGCFVGNTAACGGCFGISPCTQRGIQSQFGGTCSDFGFGVASSCGSTSDCCSDFCVTSSNATFAFCAPEGFSPCLNGAQTTDLGSTVPNTVTGATFASDDRFGSNCGGFGSPDEAFTFTAPSAGTFVFNTFGSSFDTVLQVLDPLSCDELTCSDDFNGPQSRVSVALGAGQTVVVVVDGFGGGGNFTLNVAAAGAGCGPGEFACAFGGCIPAFLRCNLQIDCPDGSDEVACGDGGGSCGNGVVDNGELCDGVDLNGETCSSATMGALPNGTLRCSAGCLLDTSLCFGLGPPPDGGGGFGSF